MAKNNTNLHNAKSAKNDEFYTMLSDIEKEMVHYKEFFKGKVVYCNCDDARDSNFFKYFSLNFEHLGLKKLICTGYKADGKGVVLTYEGDKNGNRKVDDEEVSVSELNGNGDFRSEECIEFLKEADVVVTNPPFSLFREYVAQLMEYGKKFIIIGNQNAVTNKDIFPYIKNNELWLGVSMNGANRWFIVPNDYEVRENLAGYKEEDGKRMFFVNGVVWFTNISNEKHNTPIDLCKKYNEKDYPKYDNYDAIEVSRVENIPMDYDGAMGVPISFLHKYCPNQFEIIWQASGNSYANAPKEILKELNFNPNIKYGGGLGTCVLNGKATYSRILIRKKVSE